MYAYACRPSSPLTRVRRQPRKRCLRVSRPTISAVNGRHDHLCAVVIASGLTASRLRVSALVEGVREALIHRMHAGVLAQRRPDPGGEASIGSGPPEAGSCRRPVIRRVFVLFVAGPRPGLRAGLGRGEPPAGSAEGPACVAMDGWTEQGKHRRARLSRGAPGSFGSTHNHRYTGM